jgi:hypothetical protein
MARLPQPGSDDNVWGDVLNEFLSVSLHSDGTIKSSAITSKADDSLVVHLTANESIDGSKTFTSSPIVPTPTLGTDAVNKTYVDNAVIAGAPDATTGNKGIVQLAGDLAGTAASPTVPALATKQPLDATLTALAGYNTNGLLTQTAVDTFTGRTIAGTANQVSVANGDGVAGNPTLSLPQDIAATSSPTFGGGTINGNLVVQNAATPTKAYRFRTSGNDLDWEYGGANLHLSAFPNADFSGLQKELVVMDWGDDSVKLTKKVKINEDGGDYDLQVKGLNQDYLLYGDASTDRLGIHTNAPTHTLTLASSGTGVAIYNTADQTGNYERYRFGWASNVFQFHAEAGGTGTARALQIGDSAGYLNFVPAASGGAPKFQYLRTANTSGSLFQITTSGASLTGASGTQYGLKVDPTVAQTGTAAYSMLIINPTETSTGSGAKNLIDAQVGGSSRFSVSNTGGVTIASGGIVINGNSSIVGAFSMSGGTVSISGGLSITNFDITMSNGRNMILGTTTGTKIGTATTQKLAFWNATPIVQPTGNVLTALSSLGLIDTPTLTSADVGLGNVDNTSDANKPISAATAAAIRTIQLKVIDDGATLTTGDGKLIFCIPSNFNGLTLIDADAYVTTSSSSGTPTVQIRNVTNSNADMLSTPITVDANETASYTAAVQPVIDTGQDNVATGDLLAIDVDAAGTGARGLGVIMRFG